MIPYDIDPSLHGHEPAPPVLGDGFSPPEPQQPSDPAGQPGADAAQPAPAHED
jgi:hypothetical protein